MTKQDLPRKLDVAGADRLGLIGRIDVLVDGKVIAKAVDYDVDEGFVTTFDEKDGRPIIEDGEIKTRRIFGDVTVQLKPFA